jgi:hypothetical protein
MARQLLKISPIARFRRYDDLPKAFIASVLPTFQPLRDIG